MRMIAVLEQACGRKAQIVRLPIRPGDVPETFADFSAIQNDLGYRPSTRIEEGIPAFVAWYRNYAQRVSD